MLNLLYVRDRSIIAIDSLGMNIGTTNMIDLGIDLGMKATNGHAKVEWGRYLSVKFAVKATT